MFFNSDVEGSDCTSLIQNYGILSKLNDSVSFYFLHIFGSLIGQLAGVHVVTVLLFFFVGYWRNESPEWATCIFSPSF